MKPGHTSNVRGSDWTKPESALLGTWAGWWRQHVFRAISWRRHPARGWRCEQTRDPSRRGWWHVQSSITQTSSRARHQSHTSRKSRNGQCISSVLLLATGHGSWDLAPLHHPVEQRPLASRATPASISSSAPLLLVNCRESLSIPNHTIYLSAQSATI